MPGCLRSSASDYEWSGCTSPQSPPRPPAVVCTAATRCCCCCARIDDDLHCYARNTEQSNSPILHQAIHLGLLLRSSHPLLLLLLLRDVSCQHEPAQRRVDREVRMFDYPLARDERHHPPPTHLLVRRADKQALAGS